MANSVRYVEFTRPDHYNKLIASPSQDENLVVTIEPFSIQDGYANGPYNFTNFRVHWDRNLAANNEYEVFANIGGNGWIHLGLFHSHSSSAHSDFPTSARWDKDMTELRIYTRNVEWAADAPRGVRVAKKAIR
jgi:hypothetical protein